MNNTLLAVLLPILAFIVTMAVYPAVLRFAKKHGIVDNPNARKLQRVPVPVMGGVAVFIGLVIPLIVASIYFSYSPLWVGLTAMAIMMLIGAWDDAKDIPANLRFIIEIALVWAMMYFNDGAIDSLHGLWGLQEINILVALPLTIIAGVGIINATNLIDGVDGYSSGYGIMASTMFAIMFFSVEAYDVACFSLIIAGALLPFFLHNVFGYKSKMFIGDSGTLMLGTAFAMFVLCVLCKNSPCSVLEKKGVGLVPFTLAVLAIPVFDTLRVMGARIMKGVSPFHPDKTHLHHLFIEMGFSHIGTTFSILTMNFFIVLVWWLSWAFGASIDVQTYIVIGLSLLATFGFYKFMRNQQRGGELDEDGFPTGSRIWKVFCKLGELTHMERSGFWKIMRESVDGKMLGSNKSL